MAAFTVVKWPNITPLSSNCQHGLKKTNFRGQSQDRVPRLVCQVCNELIVECLLFCYRVVVDVVVIFAKKVGRRARVTDAKQSTYLINTSNFGFI